MCHEYEDAPGIRTLFSLAASSACKEKATLHGYDSWELFEYWRFWTCREDVSERILLQICMYIYRSRLRQKQQY